MPPRQKPRPERKTKHRTVRKKCAYYKYVRRTRAHFAMRALRAESRRLFAAGALADSGTGPEGGSSRSSVGTFRRRCIARISGREGNGSGGMVAATSETFAGDRRGGGFGPVFEFEFEME